jgi:peptide/nickel transport system permease protein
LDKPWIVQFYYWLEGIVLHGSLGFSFARGEPVLDTLVKGSSPLWWTLITIGSSILVGWIVGVPLGVLGAVYYRKPAEIILFSTTYAISAIPPFTLGLAFFVIYNMLHPDHWLLPGAWGIVSQELLNAPLSWAKVFSHIHRLSLTWLLVSTPVAVVVSRHLRADLLEVLAESFIRTARAKGLASLKILFKHALRNALNPLVSMAGFMLTATIGNSILAAAVLYQPSLGGWIVYAARSQDQPLLTAILLLFSTILVVGILLSDLALAALDPRIRYD